MFIVEEKEGSEVKKRTKEEEIEKEERRSGWGAEKKIYERRSRTGDLNTLPWEVWSRSSAELSELSGAGIGGELCSHWCCIRRRWCRSTTWCKVAAEHCWVWKLKSILFVFYSVLDTTHASVCVCVCGVCSSIDGETGNQIFFCLRIGFPRKYWCFTDWKNNLIPDRQVNDARLPFDFPSSWRSTSTKTHSLPRTLVFRGFTSH